MMSEGRVNIYTYFDMSDMWTDNLMAGRAQMPSSVFIMRTFSSTVSLFVFSLSTLGHYRTQSVCCDAEDTRISWVETTTQLSNFRKRLTTLADNFLT